VLINSKEYFKHSGVKGMKWGASGANGSAGGGSEEEHTPEEILEQEKLIQQQRLREKYGMDEKGLNAENPTSGDIGPEDDKDMSEDRPKMTEVEFKPKTKVEPKPKDKPKPKRQSIPKLKPQTMMSKVKNITSSVIARGKAFIDSLFD